jgi:hypothetical protein
LAACPQVKHLREVWGARLQCGDNKLDRRGFGNDRLRSGLTSLAAHPDLATLMWQKVEPSANLTDGMLLTAHA